MDGEKEDRVFERRLHRGKSREKEVKIDWVEKLN